MPVCKICKYETIINSLENCPNCGAIYINAAQEADQNEEKFSKRTTVDPDKSHGKSSNLGGDEIELCDPSEFLSTDDEPETDSEDVPGQIGQSAPQLPDNQEEEQDTEKNNNKVTKLTEEQIKDIRSDLMITNNEYVSQADASDIMHSLTNENQKEDKPQIEQNKESNIIENQNKLDSPNAKEESKLPDESSIKRTNPHRRFAYFHKNFIQLTGSYYPSSGEELILGERLYLLKPKKIKSQYAIAAFATIMVIVLIIIGSRFINPTVPGHGSIIGFIHDIHGNPLLSGCEVLIPETGKKVISDPLGFFKFDKIPPGIYLIQSKLDDGTIFEDKITVMDNGITTVSLDITNIKAKTISQTQIGQATPNPQQSNNKLPATSQEPSTTNQQATNSNSKPAGTLYATLKLHANTENARVMMSGKVLGKGNLTYKNLTPGKHNIAITKNGYKQWSGTIRLKAGETYVLEAALEKTGQAKAQTESKKQPQNEVVAVRSAEDYYQAGIAQLAQGNFLDAIAELTEAINRKPSMADAYAKRASANQSSGQKNDAESDFVRAGEIYATQNRLESAKEMFDNALAINNKSIPAILNIADYYKRSKGTDEAIRYYKNALRIDKNNFRANFEMGKMYFSIGKNRDADKKLRKAKEINPNHPEVYHYLMLNYFARDDFGNVKKTYTAFKLNASEQELASFIKNNKFDAIHRIVGEYVRP